MLIVPDPSTATMDPFTAVPTLSVIGDVVDPITKEEYSRDPRHIAKKAEQHLKSTGIGDVAYFGPEPEFFILDDVRFDTEFPQRLLLRRTPPRASGTPAAMRGPNLGYKPRHKEGYFPVPPIDSQQDIRQEMVM